LSYLREFFKIIEKPDLPIFLTLHIPLILAYDLLPFAIRIARVKLPDCGNLTQLNPQQPSALFACEAQLN
jgi:hypothetical protein